MSDTDVPSRIIMMSTPEVNRYAYGLEKELEAQAALIAELVSLFSDAGRDNDALNSAVGVLMTQQAQPHRSTQHVLWEAIKDYADRALSKAKLATTAEKSV